MDDGSLRLLDRAAFDAEHDVAFRLAANPDDALPVDDAIAACGSCVLHLYGGLCPVTRCAKHMLNGPCSGSTEDHCEVEASRPCAWQLIYQRFKSIGQLDRLKQTQPPKNWRPSLSGCCRTIVREDHRV